MDISIFVGRYSIGVAPMLPSPAYGGRWKSDKVVGVPIFNGVSNPNWTQLPRYLENPNRNLNLEDFDEHFAREISKDSSPARRDFEALVAKSLETGKISLLCHCAPNRCHLDNVANVLAERLRMDGHSPILEDRVVRNADLAVKSLAAFRKMNGLESLEGGGSVAPPVRLSGGLHLMKPGSDMFSSSAQGLVNPVNCVGVMGAGVALEFKKRFPEIYPSYRIACDESLLSPGDVTGFRLTDGTDRVVLNAYTKDHFRDPSRPEWIVKCAKNLRLEAERIGLESLSSPLIGGGLGGVDPQFVFRTLRDAFQGSEVALELHVSPEHHRSISSAMTRDAWRRDSTGVDLSSQVENSVDSVIVTQTSGRSR